MLPPDVAPLSVSVTPQGHSTFRRILSLLTPSVFYYVYVPREEVRALILARKGAQAPDPSAVKMADVALW